MTRWCVMFILVLACAVARADEAGLRGVIGQMPDRVRGVVLIEDPMGLRSRLVPSEPAAAFTRFGFLPAIDRPWQALARALELSSERAMQELLGGGVAVVATDAPAGSDGGVSYAVVGLVSEATSARLREKLRAIPALVVEGQAVLAIENGSMWLMVRPLAGIAGERTHAVVVTASNTSDADLAVLGRMLSARAAAGGVGGGAGHVDSLGASPAWHAAFGAGEKVWGAGAGAGPARGDVVALWRGAEARPSWSIARLAVDAGVWRCSVYSSDGGAFGGGGAGANQPELDPTLVERLPAGAVLVLHDAMGVVQVDGESGVRFGITGGVNDAAPARERLVVLRRAPAGHFDLTMAERAPSAAEAGERLDRGAMALLRSARRAGDADAFTQGGPDAEVLKVMDLETWREVGLRLAPGMSMMPLVGQKPRMAWRGARAGVEAGADAGAWSVWGFSPDGAGAAMPGADAVRAIEAGRGDVGGRAYLLRLRALPHEAMGGLPAALSVPFMDVGVVHGVTVDVWREGAAVRGEAEVKWGKPGAGE